MYILRQKNEESLTLTNKILFLTLITLFASCNVDQSNKQSFDDPNCLFLEDRDMNITGNLTLDSKGNALLDFTDTVYNGKLKIVSSKSLYKDIYMNYDAFLSMKSTNESVFKVTIYGHYLSPIDTINWLNKRRNFYVHSISF